MCAKINKKYDIYLIPSPNLATFNIRIYRINNFYYHYSTFASSKKEINEDKRR